MKRSNTIGLDDDWDADLQDSDHQEESRRVGVSAVPFRPRRLKSHTGGFVDGESKAKELLRRAEVLAREASSKDADAKAKDNTVQGWWMDTDAQAPKAAHDSKSVLRTMHLPGINDPTIRKCREKAPRMMRRAFSFRASVRGGLVALPVVQSECGGAFRVKLLRLEPGLLSAGKNAKEKGIELRDGVQLLEAHQDVVFGAASPPPTTQQDFALPIPRALTPSLENGPHLLARYLEQAQSSFGTHSSESFELLSALLGDSPEKENVSDVEVLKHASQRYGDWLARVNARTVNRHLEPDSTKLRRGCINPGLLEADVVARERLKAAFHRLTSNSVRGALQELNQAANSMSSSSHFDRLAAILASCGGTAYGGSVERRMCLRSQVLLWRRQAVNEMMSPAIWQMYCLLGGEVDSVVEESLDWRTAFGMYLWYQSGDEKPGLQVAMKSFEDICRKHGRNCGFRPAPPYLLASLVRDPPGAMSIPALPFGVASSDGNAEMEPEPRDLQFNVVHAAMGKTDWNDLGQFDFMTYSPLPFDVACSWHFSLLLLVLSHSETCNVGGKSFQQLTQQYCLLLELSGNWEWALYVALFVSDERVRMRLVRGLLQRHSALRNTTSLELENRPHWVGLSPTWIWRGEALRRERTWEWSVATTCWLKSLQDSSGGSTKMKRAAALTLGFLQIPAMVKHRLAAPDLEAARFAPMTAPAKWLLEKVLVQLEAELVKTKAGREVLAVMREWSEAGEFRCTLSRLVEICNRCIAYKRQLLGIPC